MRILVFHFLKINKQNRALTFRYRMIKDYSHNNRMKQFERKKSFRKQTVWDCKQSASQSVDIFS